MRRSRDRGVPGRAGIRIFAAQVRGQQALARGNNMARRERLGNTVVGRKSEGSQPVQDLIGRGRQEHDGTSAVRPKPLEEFNAVHRGHMPIEDQQAGRPADQVRERDQRIMEDARWPFLLLEGQDQDVADVGFVVDDGDIRHEQTQVRKGGAIVAWHGIARRGRTEPFAPPYRCQTKTVDRATLSGALCRQRRVREEACTGATKSVAGRRMLGVALM